MIVRKGDKQQKLQVEKLTNDFKDALEKYFSFQRVSYFSIKLTDCQAVVYARRMILPRMSEWSYTTARLI